VINKYGCFLLFALQHFHQIYNAENNIYIALGNHLLHLKINLLSTIDNIMSSDDA